MDQGLDINYSDNNNHNALHFACFGGKKEAIKFLIEKGVDINIKSKLWSTPFFRYLMSSSNDIDIDLVKSLLPKDYSIDDVDSLGRTVLHVACTKGSEEVVKFLLKKKFDVNKKDFQGFSVLHYAIGRKDAEIVKLVLDKNTTINDMSLQGVIPLHLACSKGEKNIIKLLVENGADINLKDKEGKLAIERAPGNVKNKIKYIFKTTIVNKLDHDDLHNFPEDNNHSESKVLGEIDNEDNI